MARTETTTRTLYSFAELDDDAKERIRDWYRSCIDASELEDYDDWCNIASLLGVEFDKRPVRLMNGTTRYEPRIWWSVSGCQGDGASWEGCYNYRKGCSANIRRYAPQDTTLHAIADALQAVQRRNFYRLQATVTTGGCYSHIHTMRFDVTRTDDVDVSESDEDTLSEALRDFADWIYQQVQAQWEYLHSDECVTDTMLANEYEFTESGDIA